MLKSIIAEVEIENDFLTIPAIIEERLGINKYSKISFVIKQEGVMIQVSNPPIIMGERINQYNEKSPRQFTLLRHDFICQNPKCNNPILKKRGTKRYCSRACIFEHKDMKAIG